MSEFYQLRRHSIADLSAFFGFLVGFLGSGPVAWPFLQVGFQTGAIVKGFAYFISIICGSGVVCGAIGLGLGTAGGWVWERGHRLVREARGREPAPRSGAATYAAAATSSSSLTLAGRPMRPATEPDVLGIRFDAEDPDPRIYRDFLVRIGGVEHDDASLERALRRTTNVAAWDGKHLVGIVRVLTDGHRHAHLAELAVEAGYRRRGIARELLRRVSAAVPASIVIASVPADCEPFFGRLGLPRVAGGYLVPTRSPGGVPAIR